MQREGCADIVKCSMAGSEIVFGIGRFDVLRQVVELHVASRGDLAGLLVPLDMVGADAKGLIEKVDVAVGVIGLTELAALAVGFEGNHAAGLGKFGDGTRCLSGGRVRQQQEEESGGENELADQARESWLRHHRSVECVNENGPATGNASVTRDVGARNAEAGRTRVIRGAEL